METHTKPSQTARVLRALKQAGSRGVTNIELINMRILRGGARVFELRKEGWNINSIREKNGIWRYVLIPEHEGMAD